MGVTYDLLHDESHEWIALGKKVSGGYQRQGNQIIQFIETHGIGTYRILSDAGDLPHMESDEWTEVSADTWPGSRSNDSDDNLPAIE